MTRPGSLGSGMVFYHEDRPIVHFGNVEDTQYRPVSTHNMQVIQELPQ